MHLTALSSRLAMSRSKAAWACLMALMLISGSLGSAPAKKPAGSPAWHDFPRGYQVPRYEMDIDHDPNPVFGVTQAFKPYQDPDRKETEGLANPFDNPDFRSYNLIVIVNKKDHPFWGRAQTLRVYKRGVAGLHYYWLISTGRKGFETPSGYYRPQAFSSRHYSSKYDAPMQWSVFFNRGMALHSSLDRQAMKEMGHEAASHGCIHVEDYRAQELFHLVGHSGYGPVDVIDRVSGRKTGRKVSSYKTLIIVSPVAHWSHSGKATHSDTGATPPVAAEIISGTSPATPADSIPLPIPSPDEPVTLPVPTPAEADDAIPSYPATAPEHPVPITTGDTDQAPDPADQDAGNPAPYQPDSSTHEALPPGVYSSE